MWNPFKRRSRAQVQGMVVANATTGLHEAHYVITVDEIDDAPEAMLEAFATAVGRYRSDRDFGGDVVLVVYGPPVSGVELEPELQYAKTRIESKIADSGLKTTAGRPFRVQVQRRSSAF